MSSKPHRPSRLVLFVPFSMLLAACGADRDDSEAGGSPAAHAPARSNAAPDAGLSGASGATPRPKAPDAGRPAPRRDAEPEPEPTPDATEPPAPDAAAPPDAVETPDAETPDAVAPSEPDAAAPPEPDAGPQPEPDAAPPAPPVGPELPALAPTPCGGIPAFESEFLETAPDQYEMVVTPSVQHSAEGSCGGRGSDLILAFTAPAAGEWTFAADTDGAYPWVVYARETCDAPETELGCAGSDDIILPADIAPGAGEPRVVGDGVVRRALEAGERVYLVADAEFLFAGCGVVGFGGGCGWSDGPYSAMTLLATRSDAPSPPSIVSARVTRHGGVNLVVELEVADADADALGVEVTGTHRGGLPVLADGRPLDGLALPVPTLPGHTLRSGRVLLRDTIADHLSLVARDAHGGHSAPFEVDVGPRVSEGVGDACDPSLPPEFTCGDGGVCTWRGDAATCVGAEPPTLIAARVLRDAGTLLLEVTGTDINGEDYPAAYVELLTDADDTPLRVGPVRATELVGDEIDTLWGGVGPWPLTRLYTLMVDRAPFEAASAPEATRARVTWVDRSGLTSAPLIVPLTDPTPRAPGQGCRPDALGGACAEGSTCVLYSTWGVHVCEDPRPPTLLRAEAGRAPDGRLTLALEVAEGAHPLQFVNMERLDARGELIPLPSPPRREFQMLMASDGVLVEGVWHFALRTPLDLDSEPETAGLRLTPYESIITQPLLPVDVPIMPLVPQPAGAVCDPLAVRSVCDSDLVCPADALRCTRP